MKNYKEKIIEKCNNLNICFDEGLIEMYNDFINFYISNGDTEEEALKFAFLILEKNKNNKL